MENTPQIDLNETTMKVETTSELETEIGTKEIESLKAETVKIASVKIEVVGKNNNKKVVVTVKHPAKEELIHISSIKYENPKSQKMEIVGLWYNLDDDKMIRKGSHLAVFMSFVEITKLSELEGKDLATVVDEKGYLCFKSY